MSELVHGIDDAPRAGLPQNLAEADASEPRTGSQYAPACRGSGNGPTDPRQVVTPHTGLPRNRAPRTRTRRPNPS